MRERPHQTLGRLIFERGILPQKLDAMMSDFPYLHITEVLVKCCCPMLPGRGVPLLKKGEEEREREGEREGEEEGERSE